MNSTQCLNFYARFVQLQHFRVASKIDTSKICVIGGINRKLYCILTASVKTQTLIPNCLVYIKAKNAPLLEIKRIIKRNKLLAFIANCFQTHKAYKRC